MIPFTESDAFEFMTSVIRVSLEAIETNVLCCREQLFSVFLNYSYCYSS